MTDTLAFIRLLNLDSLSNFQLNKMIHRFSSSMKNWVKGRNHLSKGCKSREFYQHIALPFFSLLRLVTLYR
jgi:hypothetical protein